MFKFVSHWIGYNKKMNVNHERAVCRQLLLQNVLMCVTMRLDIHTLSLTSLVVGTRPVHVYTCTIY